MTVSRRAQFLRFIAAFSWLLVSACGPALPGGAPPFELWDESGESLQSLPSVARLHLVHGGQVPLADYWWIKGDVSSASANQLKLRQVPKTVENGRLPLSSWTTEGETIFAPGEPLGPGERYTLVALGAGIIAQLRAAEEQAELWHRWGDGNVVPGDAVSYCRWQGTSHLEFAEPGAALAEMSTELSDGTAGGSGDEPLGIASEYAGIVPGIFEDQCMTFIIASQNRSAFVPPARRGGIQLHPAAIGLINDSPAITAEPNLDQKSNLRDQERCLSLGVATLCVDGPALVLRTFGRNIALQISTAQRLVGRFAAYGSTDETFRIGPVEAETTYYIRGVVFESQDQNQSELVEGSLLTQGAAARFSITEMLSDPSGSEAQGEWIEVQNIGSLVGSLAGYEIWDDAGAASLPNVSLEPGQIGLIIRNDFVSRRDLLPSAQAIPIWVETLGANGLRNSGEAVELRDRAGVVQSIVPALPSQQDVSIARISPWAPDVPASFASHGEPGASPGAPNHFNSPIESF